MITAVEARFRAQTQKCVAPYLYNYIKSAADEGKLSTQLSNVNPAIRDEFMKELTNLGYGVKFEFAKNVIHVSWS